MMFAYTRPDGGVSIVIAAPKERIELVLGPMTTDEYREHVVNRSIPADAVDVCELQEPWTPPDADRTFRDAWRHTKGKFRVDMAMARDIWRSKLRQARTPLLTALDTQYMRADERRDTEGKKEIAAQKQALRDITDDPAIEAAKTPESLKAVWPSVLGRRSF